MQDFLAIIWSDHCFTNGWRHVLHIHRSGTQEAICDALYTSCLLSRFILCGAPFGYTSRTSFILLCGIVGEL